MVTALLEIGLITSPLEEQLHSGMVAHDIDGEMVPIPQKDTHPCEDACQGECGTEGDYEVAIHNE